MGSYKMGKRIGTPPRLVFFLLKNAHIKREKEERGRERKGEAERGRERERGGGQIGK